MGNFLEEVAHHPLCTWLKHVEAGEKPPGQSFWGELNYLWCQKFCKRTNDHEPKEKSEEKCWCEKMVGIDKIKILIEGSTHCTIESIKASFCPWCGKRL